MFRWYRAKVNLTIEGFMIKPSAISLQWYPCELMLHIRSRRLSSSDIVYIRAAGGGLHRNKED